MKSIMHKIAQILKIRRPFEETPEINWEPLKINYEGMKDMAFSEALIALKDGKKVKRHDWGGYWFYTSGLSGWEPNGTTRVIMNSMIVAKLKNNGGYVPATPYQEDLLADDWEVVE
ncbi:MAG: MW1434 family type I TA system toxin [Sporolactobacillus sp.]